MRILLIDSPVSPFDVVTGVFAMSPPHHLERIAGALVADHDVEILDMRIETDLAGAICAFHPHMVGCSCVAANAFLAKRVLREAKKIDPGIVTVAGGHHPSLMPEDFDDPAVDFIVIGEGEVTLHVLAETLEANADPSSVGGIAFRDADGTFRINPRRAPMDLKGLPPAARHLTKKHRDRNLYFRSSWRPVDCIISSRGCPFRCNFCGLWKIHQGKCRYRAPENVIDELETIEEPYVLFLDDNTLQNVQNASRMADMIRARGITKTYDLYGRADTVARHPWLIEKWRDIGMKLLLIGIEACDDGTLTSMNKRTSADENKKAMEICRANDVEIVAYFIVDPQFEHDDFDRLFDYVQRNELTHPMFTILSPFPGTDMYQEMKGELTTDRFELYDLFHAVLPTKLPLDKFYEEFTGLWQRAYPRERFVEGLTEGMSMLSPKMIANMQILHERMLRIPEHHLVSVDDFLTGEAT